MHSDAKDVSYADAADGTVAQRCCAADMGDRDARVSVPRDVRVISVQDAVKTESESSFMGLKYRLETSTRERHVLIPEHG
jgi:hypothetical protein